MNTRRRILTSGEEDIMMSIHHPDYLYVEFSTSSTNVNRNLWYAVFADTAILDGSTVPAANIYYTNQYSGVKVPTTGEHTLYAKPKSWTVNSKTYRPYGTDKLVILNTESNVIRQSSTHTSLRTLVCLSTTPPTFTYDYTNFTKMESVLVPKEAVAAYKTAFPQWKDIIKGVVFNIIND